MNLTPEIVNGLFVLIGAVVGAAGTYWATRANKEKSQLSFLISESTPIVEPTQNIGGALQIRFGDQNVKSVYSSEISIVNTGNKSVSIDDLDVNFFGSVQILSSQASGGDVPADSISITILNHNCGAKLSCGFLNPNERIDLNFLLSGKPSEIEVDYRLPNLRTKVLEPSDLNARRFARTLIETTAFAALKVGGISFEIRGRK